MSQGNQSSYHPSYRAPTEKPLELLDFHLERVNEKRSVIC